MFRKYRHMDVLLAMIEENARRNGVDVKDVKQFNSLDIELQIRKRLRNTEKGKEVLLNLRGVIPTEQYEGMVELFRERWEKVQEFMDKSKEVYQGNPENSGIASLDYAGAMKQMWENIKV